MSLMFMPARSPDDACPPVADTLTNLPLADFVAAWRRLVGEPPAVMLDSRSEMIRLLVESVPVAQPSPAGEAAGAGDWLPRCPGRW